MFTREIQDVLFLDIETAPMCPSFSDLDPSTQYLWEKKSLQLAKHTNIDSPSNQYERAGIYAEFGRIICICVGKISKDAQGKYYLKLRSFYNDDEQRLLLEFKSFLDLLSPQTVLCAHNGKEFDFPYICRRMLINQMVLPNILNIAGKKPWEVHHLDTMELWKFGDYKHYTSLELLAHVFNIESPKQDIDGSMVHKVYYEENDPQRIVDYCYRDVITIAQLLLRFQTEELIHSENIYYV